MMSSFCLDFRVPALVTAYDEWAPLDLFRCMFQAKNAAVRKQTLLTLQRGILCFCSRVASASAPFLHRENKRGLLVNWSTVSQAWTDDKNEVCL